MSETNPQSSYIATSPDLQQEMDAVLARLDGPKEVEYKLLTGHNRTDGSYKTDEQLRTEYIHRTDALIQQMTEGVEVTDPVSGETVTAKPDFVVWLDKSARPVAWLTKELWPKLAPAPGEPVPDMPAFRFANIDREQWVNTVDPEGLGYMDISRIDQSIIRSLRSLFIAPEHKAEGLTEKIDTAPSELDGKTVLIVDEVRASGRTLDIAKKFFNRAFPTAKVATSHWMGGVAQKGGASGNADLPVWYKEKTETGRGIANRDETASMRSNSVTQRLGTWFLSTRFPEMDPSSVQLREELKRLAHDDEVLIVPSLRRADDDFEKRATALNNTDMDTFVQRKNEISAQKRPN